MASEHPGPAAAAARPKLLVFDLDLTLWPFIAGTHHRPPFHERNGTVFDSSGRELHPFPESSAVLEECHAQGYLMAVASRSGDKSSCKQLMALFGCRKYFKYVEIYPGCKKRHFSRIHKVSKIPLSDMLFFDDDGINIRDLTQLGVMSILVSRSTGINKYLVKEGLAKFARERSCGKVVSDRRN